LPLSIEQERHSRRRAADSGAQGLRNRLVRVKSSA
jgi:hypothetical protein